jgi:hypothetical protein
MAPAIAVDTTKWIARPSELPRESTPRARDEDDRRTRPREAPAPARPVLEPREALRGGADATPATGRASSAGTPVRQRPRRSLPLQFGNR